MQRTPHAAAQRTSLSTRQQPLPRLLGHAAAQRAARPAAPPPQLRRLPRAPRRGPRPCCAAGDDEDAAERQRRAALEDELRDPGSPLEFLFPRAVRRVAYGALAGGAALSLALGLQRAAAAPALAADDGTGVGLAVNAAVLAAAAAAFAGEAAGEEARRERRAASRAAQDAAGDREQAPLPGGGGSYSRLKQVDDAWIVKRLERWGAQDNLPMLGPVKAAALQALVREARPRSVLEIGTLLGYSAIRIAQALPDDGCKVVTVERELQYVLSARRFLWQCNQGERAPGEPRVGRRVRVEWGDAAAVAQRLAREGRVFDFLLIDGVPSESLAHLRACEPLLAPGATVVAHNTRVFAQSLAPYLAYVREGVASGRFASTREVATTFGWPGRGDAPDALEVSVWRGGA
jgi:predicted O-methyltransferase YrrM